MWRFFERYPDAKSASEADIDDVQRMIQPLGLSERRSKALVRMSKEYTQGQWKSDPKRLYGIGKYASDAYQIFCLGNWRDIQPKDHALNDYRAWLKSQYA